MPRHTPRSVFFIALLLSFELSGGSRSLPEVGADEPSMVNAAAAPLPANVGALVDITDNITWNRHGHHRHGHNNVVVVNPGRHHHGHRHGHTNVVVVNPGRGHRHHHGPGAGAIFATAAAAMAAGAIIGAATRPPTPPRGAMVVVTPPAQPTYITSNGQRMMQVIVAAPNWCAPCSNEPIEVRMSGGTYFVTSPPTIWAGQSFLAYLPAPMPPPPVIIPEPAPVAATIISQGGPVWTLQVQVPPPKMPGQSFKVRLPNGALRPYQVPPGIFAGQFFQIQYNPAQELLSKIASKNRCCCHDSEPVCFWVFQSITDKKDGHCPRFQKTANGFCALKSCKLFDSSCQKSHHTPAEQGRKCPATTDKLAFIREC